MREDYDLLTVEDVAKVLVYSVAHVRRMIRDGEFPEGFPAPKHLRWRWRDVREWIDRHKWENERRKTVSNREQSGASAKVGEKAASQAKGQT